MAKKAATKKKAAKKTAKKDTFPVEKFLTIRATGAGSWSPDDKWIVFQSNMGGEYNLWKIPAEGGWPTQISFENEALRGASWINKDMIVLMQDHEGNENHQIKSLPAEGGLITDLTKTPEVQHFLGGKSKDGWQVAFTANYRDVTKFDTYIMDLKTGRKKCVAKRPMLGQDFVTDWSKNGRYLAIIRHIHNLDTPLQILDLKTKKMRPATEYDEDVFFGQADFTPDSRHIYAITDYKHDFKCLVKISVKTGKLEYIFKGKNDCVGFTLSHDGRKLIYVLDKDGNRTPIMMDTKTGRLKTFKLRKGLYGAFTFSHNDEKLLYSYTGPKDPPDIHVLNLKTGKAKQLTESLVGGWDRKDFIAPRVFSCKSFDGLTIKGLFYLPKGAKKDGRTPLILEPHGGPNFHNPNVFKRWVIAYLAQGYAVILPDFRGSTGYGKKFQRMINKDWGGADLKDQIASVEWAIGTGYIDPKRIGVAGGSYGGFATLSCITKYPKMFKAAVDIFGPSNLFTFINSNPPSWRRSVYEFIGDPVKDEARLKDSSPITHVEKIRTPLLVIQGVNDPRVAKAESDQIVKKLRKRGRVVEYIVFDDEGHGFTKRENEMTALKASLEFLRKYL